MLDRETYTIGYSVIETTDAEAALERGDELISELKMAREDGDLTAMLLAIVDIVHLNSILLISGVVEESLATAAYGQAMNLEQHCMALPGKSVAEKGFYSTTGTSHSTRWVGSSTSTVR